MRNGQAQSQWAGKRVRCSLPKPKRGREREEKREEVERSREEKRRDAAPQKRQNVVALLSFVHCVSFLPVAPCRVLFNKKERESAECVAIACLLCNRCRGTTNSLQRNEAMVNDKCSHKLWPYRAPRRPQRRRERGGERDTGELDCVAMTERRDR